METAAPPQEQMAMSPTVLQGANKPIPVTPESYGVNRYLNEAMPEVYYKGVTDLLVSKVATSNRFDLESPELAEREYIQDYKAEREKKLGDACLRAFGVRAEELPSGISNFNLLQEKHDDALSGSPELQEAHSDLLQKVAQSKAAILEAVTHGLPVDIDIAQHVFDALNVAVVADGTFADNEYLVSSNTILLAPETSQYVVTHEVLHAITGRELSHDSEGDIRLNRMGIKRPGRYEDFDESVIDSLAFVIDGAMANGEMPDFSKMSVEGFFSAVEDGIINQVRSGSIDAILATFARVSERALLSTMLESIPEDQKPIQKLLSMQFEHYGRTQEGSRAPAYKEFWQMMANHADVQGLDTIAKRKEPLSVEQVANLDPNSIEYRTRNYHGLEGAVEYTQSDEYKQFVAERQAKRAAAKAVRVEDGNLAENRAFVISLRSHMDSKGAEETEKMVRHLFGEVDEENISTEELAAKRKQLKATVIESAPLTERNGRELWAYRVEMQNRQYEAMRQQEESERRKTIRERVMASRRRRTKQHRRDREKSYHHDSRWSRFTGKKSQQTKE